MWDQAKSIRFEDEQSTKDTPTTQSIQRTSYQARNLKQSASTTSLVSPSPMASPRTPSIHQEPNQSLPLNKSMSSLTINTSCSGRSQPGTRRLSLVGMSRRLNYSDSSSSEASPTESRSSTMVPRGIVARRMKAFTDSLGRNQIVVEGSKRQRHKSEKEPAKSKSDWDLRKLHEDTIPQTRQNEKLGETDSLTPTKGVLYNQMKQTKEQYMEELEASPNDLPVRDGTSAVASNYLDLNTTPCKKFLDSFLVQL